MLCLAYPLKFLRHFKCFCGEIRKNVNFFIPSYTIEAGYYGFTLYVLLSVRPSAVCPSAFSFLDDNLGECQWIFTKLDMCIDIVAIWFWIANRQISSII